MITHKIFPLILILLISAMTGLRGDANADLITAVTMPQKATIQAIKDALANEAKIDAPGVEGRTALMFAAAQDYDEVVQFLIDSGANVNAVDRGKKTPLMWAMMHEPKSAVRYHGIFESPATILIKYLIDRGADVNAATDDGTTPLMYALIMKARKEVINYLLDHGAIPLATDKNGRSVLSFAQGYAPQYIELIQKAIEKQKAK